MNKMYQKTISDVKTPAKRHFGGFTLIELLVVVLIIGILAAVALPQYQRAVAKARLSEGLVVGKSIVNAENAYKMENGTYTTDIDALGVSFPAGGVVTTGTDKVEVSYPSKNIRYVIQESGGWRLEFYMPDVVVQRMLGWDYDQCVIRTETGRYLCQMLGADSSEGTVKPIPKL